MKEFLIYTSLQEQTEDCLVIFSVFFQCYCNPNIAWMYFNNLKKLLNIVAQ